MVKARPLNIDTAVKITSFLIVIVSSFGFSFLLLYTRIFYESNVIAQIIDYQSKVVFFSFMLQGGLRAATRNLFNMGRPLIAEASIRVLIGILATVSMLYLFFTVFYSPKLYISTAALISMTTVMLGLAIIKKTFYILCISAIFNLLATMIPGMVILFQGGGHEIYSEMTSTFLMASFLFFIKLRPSVELKKFLIVLKYGFPLQVGSLFIYLSVFLFAQLVVGLSQQSPALAKIYADAQVFSGIVLLLLAKSLLFMESRIFKKDAIESIYVVAVLLMLILALLFSLLETTFNDKATALSCFLIFITLCSRLSVGYLVQYTRKNKKYSLLIMLAIVVCSLLSLNVYSLDYPLALNLSFLFSVPMISFIYLFLCISKKDPIFLNREDSL